MISVRGALLDEIENIILLGKRGHAKSENAQYQFNEAKARTIIASCIVNARTCAFVALAEEKLVGLLLGQEQEYTYIKMRYATDIVIYAETPGAGKRLIKRFEQWAFNERKVDQVLLGVSFGGKSTRAAAFYERMGFKTVGGIFTKQRGTS